MYRIAALALLAVVTSTVSAEDISLDFDPYDGTTTESTAVATASEYKANSTPSVESQPASALGLTPGFWKQDQHFYAWTDHTQVENYNSVFGVNDGRASMTLLDAMRSDGGQEIALGRHAVAALLNSTSPHVHYAYTKDQVIAMVQNAYATGDYEATKNLLDTANNAGGEIPKY